MQIDDLKYEVIESTEQTTGLDLLAPAMLDMIAGGEATVNAF